MAPHRIETVMQTSITAIGRIVRAWAQVAATHRAAEWVRRLAARPAVLAVMAVGAIAVALAGLGLIQRASAAIAVLASLLTAVLFDVARRRQQQTSTATRASTPTIPGAAATFLPQLLDGLLDPVILLDRTKIVIQANEATRELFPRIRRDTSLSHATRDPELLDAIDAVLAGEPARTVILHTRVPLERRISARVAALSDPNAPQTKLVLVTLRDLTEQDRLTQTRADFVAYASHELRTPLAALRGFVETLQGPARDDPAAQQRFLAIMAEQAARMTRLIDDLLSLSRIEMHAHLPPKGKVDLAELIPAVGQELAPLAKSARITLAWPEITAPAIVRGDRDEIVQVLQNLIQNAIKYGKPDGRVDVTLARETVRDRQRFVVTVRDDGPGIAAEHLPRLTERFYRVNVATSRDKGGTGLGLAIVKHILSRHGSELRIASTLGKGSTFSFALDELPFQIN